MTAEHVVYKTGEQNQPQLEPPAFMINPDADNISVADGVTLDDFSRKAMADPTGHLAEVTSFIQNPNAFPPDSIWHRLTDRKHPETLASYYLFDNATIQAIQDDPTWRLISARRGGDPHRNGRELRAEGLKIFFQRLRDARAVGNLSLHDAA